MAGHDTVRGIAYQQAHAVHAALDVAEGREGSQLRVEGMEDVVDIETLDSEGRVVSAIQVKARSGRAWGRRPIVDVLSRWAHVGPEDARFSFVTNGLLGPSATALQGILAADAWDASEVATALGIPIERSASLRHARVRVDLSTTGALLASAERRIAGMLDPLTRDLEEHARRSVERLFVALIDRASRSDPSHRLIDADEIRALLEGYLSRPELGWTGGLRDQFIQTTKSSHDNLAPLSLHGGGEVSPSKLKPTSLLTNRPLIVHGRTGSGKTSVVRLAQQQGAMTGRAVIICRAEAYTPGYLDALIADSLSAALGDTIPSIVGRQAMADPDATVVIDGVSEIPVQTASLLADDLRPLLQRSGLASIVLVGRELGIMKRVVATAEDVEAVYVAPLDDFEQRAIVERALDDGSVTDALIERLRSEANRLLRGGARNPFLLALFARTRDGEGVCTRAALYESMLRRMHERQPSVDLPEYITPLGAVFAHLIMQGRRFADRYTWNTLTDEIAERLGVEADALRTAAQRVGLVNELDHTGVVVPFHDSVADYLAAVAIRRRVAPTPTRLTQADSEWVRFASEMGVELAPSIARFLPFESLGVSTTVSPKIAPAELADAVEPLIAELVGVDTVRVEAHEAPDGRRIVSTPGIPEAALVVVALDSSPLAAAVRLWRSVLQVRLAPAAQVAVERAEGVADARRRLLEHARDRRKHLAYMLNEFPAPQKDQLLEFLRPLGTSFFVGPPLADSNGLDWELTYYSSPETRVLDADPGREHSRTTVEHYLDGGPAFEAAKLLQKGIEALVDRRGWLA